MTLSQLKNKVSDRTGAGAVIQTFIANSLIQAINILCGIFCARVLGPEGRGELAAIIMWPQFLAYALTLGIPLASVYQLRRIPSQRQEIAGTALCASGVMGLLAALLGWIVIPFSIRAYPTQIVHFARLAALLAPVSLVAITLSVQVQSTGSFRHYNLFRAAIPLTVLSALAAEWWFGLLSPGTAAMAYLLAGLPITVWNLIWVCNYFRLQPKFYVNQLRPLLNYGIRAWGADLIGTASSQIDRLMIVSLLAPKQMGLYVVSQSAANLISVLPAAMVPVLMPKAVNRPLTEIVALTGRATRATIVVLLAVGVPLMLTGGSILRLFYGNKFDSSGGIVFQLLLLESMIDGVSYVLSQAFLAAGSPGTVALLEAASLLTAVPCLAILVPRWGLLGAGISVVIVTAVRLATVLANFSLRLKVRPPSLMISMADIAILRSAA